MGNFVALYITMINTLFIYKNKTEHKTEEPIIRTMKKEQVKKRWVPFNRFIKNDNL